MDHSFDLLVCGATLVSDRDMRHATLAVRDGRVAGILAPDERPPAREVIAARGLHLLPGVIDTHVHTRHPGHPGREDFRSGTSAAAAGGITTLMEMPISKLPASSAANLEGRVAAMTPEALVDFALYAGAGQENVAAIASVAQAGAVAFKTFLQAPPPERKDEFVGLWCLDPASLRDVMAAVAATGLRHCFHCEDYPLLSELQRRLESQGRRDGRAHAESRPPIVEESAVARVLALAAEAGGPVQIVHLSSPRSAELVLAARSRGVDVGAETCPAYLFLSLAALETHCGFAKCNPPLRSEREIEALWRHVAAGTIDVIGSDHSPFLDEEKAAGARDIFQAPPGLCGMEVLLPAMLTGTAQGRIGLSDVVRLTSARAAAMFHLPGKGRLEIGCDADFVLVDRAAQWRFDHTRAQTRSRGNMRAYDGMMLHGRVLSTFVRGVPVYREGEVVGVPGHGRFVRPEPAREAPRHA